MTTYIAWDGKEYPLPTPDGWYLGSDDRWWPEGYGPGPAAGPPAGVPAAAPPAAEPDSFAPPAAMPPPGMGPGGGIADAPSPADMPFADGGSGFPGATTPPSSAPVGAAPTDSGSGGSGAKILLIGVAVLLVVAGAAAAYGLLAGGDDDDGDTAPTTVPITETSEDGGTTTTAGDNTDTTSGGDSTTTAPAAGKGSADDPYNIRETIQVTYTDVGEGAERVWEIEVLEPVSDQTDLVLAENQFNDPPPEGFRFAVAPVRVRYVSGPPIASLFDFNFKALGPSGVVLTTFDPSCGVVHDGLDTLAEVAPGGEVQGNLCWVAEPSDIPELVMLIEVFLVDGETYAKLHE